MDIPKDDLVEAAGALVSPLMLSALTRQLASAGSLLTLEEAGGAILGALCPETRYGPLGVKRLVGCEIFHGGEATLLDPSQCAMHPGLSDWTPPSLAQALMLPVESAFSMIDATSTLPLFDTVSVVVAEGHCSGHLTLTFPNSGATAVIHYGQPRNPDLFTATSHSISGDGLWKLGHLIRRLANAARAEATEVQKQEQALGGLTVH